MSAHVNFPYTPCMPKSTYLPTYLSARPPACLPVYLSITVYNYNELANYVKVYFEANYIHFFLNFERNMYIFENRLGVAILTCTHRKCFEQKMVTHFLFFFFFFFLFLFLKLIAKQSVYLVGFRNVQSIHAMTNVLDNRQCYKSISRE